MLSYDLKVGQAIAIGDVACLALDEKSGNRIKVRISTPRPYAIEIIPSGIIPQIFVRGITGERRPYQPPQRPLETAAA